MVARDLWRKLQTPPSPYWRSLIAQGAAERAVYAPWAYVSVGLIVASLGTLLLVNGVLWAMFVAARLARVMANNQQSGTLDTLNLTPLGQTEVAWQLFAGILHYEIQMEHFMGLRRLGITILVLPLALLLPALVLRILVLPDGLGPDVFLLLSIALSLILVAYLDPIYGLLSGGLLGILAARRAGGDAQTQALALAVALHLAVFVLAGLFAFVLLPLLLQRLGLWHWASIMSLALAAVLVYIGLHEGMMWVLWRLVQE